MEGNQVENTFDQANLDWLLQPTSTDNQFGEVDLNQLFGLPVANWTANDQHNGFGFPGF